MRGPPLRVLQPLAHEQVAFPWARAAGEASHVGGRRSSAKASVTVVVRHRMCQVIEGLLGRPLRDEG